MNNDINDELTSPGTTTTSNININTNSDQNNSNKSTECSQLLNVNIINEESSSNAIKLVSSSLLSISSIANKKFKNSNLSLNKKLAASNLISTIKNTTLHALSKPIASRSSSPKTSLKKTSNQPIDLEAHIIVNKNDTIGINEESTDDDEEDELDEEDRDEDTNEDYKDYKKSLSTKNKKKLSLQTRKRASLRSGDLTKSLCEEEEEDEDENENIASMVGDLDESYFLNGSKQKLKETSKLNTSSVPKPSLKTLSNCSNTKKCLKDANDSDTIQNRQLRSKSVHNTSLDSTNSTNTKYLNVNSKQPSPNNNLPIKTILSNSNKSTTNTLNLNASFTNHPIGSRQSVSFSDDTFFNTNKVLKENETEPVFDTDQEKTSQNRFLMVQGKKELLKQESVISAPASTNTYDLDLERLTKSSTLTDYQIMSDRLRPSSFVNANSDLALSSSFASSGFNSSFSQSFKNRPSFQQQVPIKVLHKSMTKGSKAMRIMGSNNTGMLANGSLKNSPSTSGAVSLKSSSSRSSAYKKQQQKRLFFKNGNINISRCNIDKRRRRYMTDIFTTLIDLKWRYNILVFALGFFVSWTLFAMTWYLISYFHGDLDSLGDKNRTVCISGIHGFAGAILFSIETQQTIGYGVRYTTENCPEAILVMMIQSSVGVMIQSFMVGVVFAKLSRPKKRSETLMFSKNAVIGLRDGRLCLICRVGDMRKSHIVEAHVRMYLIKKKVTLEGEIMPLHMYDLNVGWDKGLDRLFLVWPLTIEHNIDENSPFWTITADDLKKERFELAVILEGIVESTGMTTQARSSYLVNEILWGHRFEKLITFQKEDGTYKIDYSRFDMTVPIDTPTCSAKELAELKEEENYYNLVNLNDSTPSTINSRETNGNCDLRKRRVEASNKENNFDETVTTTPNIRMVVEDHSEFVFNENNSSFDNFSQFQTNANCAPDTTTTTINTLSNTLKDNQFTTCI